MAQAMPALIQAASCIEAELASEPLGPPSLDPPGFGIPAQPYLKRPDVLLAADLTPWLLSRLQLACGIAHEMRLAAHRMQA